MIGGADAACAEPCASGGTVATARAVTAATPADTAIVRMLELLNHVMVVPLLAAGWLWARHRRYGHRATAVRCLPCHAACGRWTSAHRFQSGTAARTYPIGAAAPTRFPDTAQHRPGRSVTMAKARIEVAGPATTPASADGGQEWWRRAPTEHLPPP